MLFPGEWTTLLEDLLSRISVHHGHMLWSYVSWLHTRTETWCSLTFDSCLLWLRYRPDRLWARARIQKKALSHTRKFIYYLKAILLTQPSGTGFPINFSFFPSLFQNHIDISQFYICLGMASIIFLASTCFSAHRDLQTHFRSLLYFLVDISTAVVSPVGGRHKYIYLFIYFSLIETDVQQQDIRYSI